MLNVSGDFMVAATAPARTIVASALINGQTTISGDDYLIGFSIEEGMDNETGMSLGTTEMSMLEMDIRKPTGVSLENGTVVPYAGYIIDDDGIEEVVPMGKYYITDVSTDDDWNTVHITGYDGFSRTEVDYTPTISFPAYADDIIDDICTQLNITNSITWDVNPLIDNFFTGTCREWIGWIAGILGCNARFNRTGCLVFLFYTASTVEIDDELQYLNGLEHSKEAAFTIHSITTGTTDNPITVGNGVGISFTNPLITVAQATAIYNRLNGMAFNAGMVEWRGNPAVEVGDIVTVEGYTYNMPIMHQRIEVMGGLKAFAYCYGQTEQSIAITASPTTQRIQKVYNDLNTAITTATQLINGAVGGIFRVTDSNNDGVNDGWLLSDSPDISTAQRLIKANSQGIGLSTNGGTTYTTAITADGINADTVTTGKMSAERIEVNGGTLNDYFRVSTDANGHPVVEIGAEGSAIVLKQYNDRIAFYDTNGTELAYWTNNAFEIVNLSRFRLGALALQAHDNNSISFIPA